LGTPAFAHFHEGCPAEAIVIPFAKADRPQRRLLRLGRWLV